MTRRFVPLQAAVTPQFGHLPPSQGIGIAGRPLAQPGGAGRHCVGGQQPGHQTVNLVAAEHHVLQQQTDQLGCGEAQERRRLLGFQ